MSLFGSIAPESGELTVMANTILFDIGLTARPGRTFCPQQIVALNLEIEVKYRPKLV